MSKIRTPTRGPFAQVAVGASRRDLGAKYVPCRPYSLVYTPCQPKGTLKVQGRPKATKC